MKYGLLNKIMQSFTSAGRGQRADGKELGLQELHATAAKVHGWY